MPNKTKPEIFGLVITSFNRANLLKESLLQIEKTLWPKEFTAGHIIIIDDFSQDIECIRLIAEWQPELPENWQVHKLLQRKNVNMFGTLPIGFEYAIKQGCTVLCNLDNDILCKPFWLQKMYSLYKKFPDRIISGFNPFVDISQNKENDEKTAPLGYVEKMQTSGINLMFSLESYYEYFIPAFETKLHWDWKVCDLTYRRDGKLCVTSYPSCIQHTGLKSSLGKPEAEAATAKDYNLPDPIWDKFVKEGKKSKQPDKKKFDLDVIILSWAKTDELRKTTETAIETLINSEPNTKINIIVVESHNDAKPYGKHKTLYYYKESKTDNFIYNKAVNIALDYCSGADYIAVCNNDLEFQQNWFTIIREAMVTGGFMSACPIAPGFRGQVEFEKLVKPVEGYEITKHFGGWCFVLNREVLPAIGFKLSEKVDFWYSDNVYVDQLVRSGIRHALVTQSKVKHVESKTLFGADLGAEKFNELTGGQRTKYESQKLELECKKFNDQPPDIAKNNEPQKQVIAVTEGDYIKSKIAGTGKKVFKHSGNIGDIICSLPTIKALSNDATVLLNVDKLLQEKIGSSMPVHYANAIKPLLLSQPYITKVEFYTEGMHVDYDLDLFRKTFANGQKILPYAHLETFKLPREIANEKWIYLKAEPAIHKYRAIVNRTGRYHSVSGEGWLRLFNTYRIPEIAFIGTRDEHAAFCSNFGRKIDYLPTDNFLDVARIINTCECFAGNGSVCFTIAEGLKHPNLILEADKLNDTINMQRDGVYAVY